MTIGIYKITCKETGRCYIGQSIDIEGRWVVHRRKYAKSKFDYEILLKCDEDVLDFFERAFINGYDSFNNGFNETRGGSGFARRGVPHTNETKAKMRKADKSYMQTEEYKAKHRNRDSSFMKTEAYRQKMKEAQIKRRIREGNWKGCE